MKILVTGSGGMLGRALVDVLRRDHEVWGLGRRANPHEGVPYLRADLAERASFAGEVAGGGFEWVVHTAAWTDVDGCERDPHRAWHANVGATSNLVSSLEGTEARFVFLSTDYVYDGAKRVPYVETDRTGPLNVYGRTKLEAEGEVAGARLGGAFILRTSWLYGAGGVNFVDKILSTTGPGAVLKVVADQVGAPTYAPDLAQGIADFIAAASRSSQLAPGVYHLTQGGWTSWYEFARDIVALAGVKAQVIPVPSRELTRPAKRPANSMLSMEKLYRATRLALRPYREALADYLEAQGARARVEIPLPKAPRHV